jgi:hypothetical protein
MKAKMLEVRDVATFIPMLAVQLEPDNFAAEFLLTRAGFGRGHEQQRQYVLLCRINGGGGPCATDPYDWQSSTFRQVHFFVNEHWDEIQSGDVIDLEFIRGDSAAPKVSERFDMENPL